MQSAGLRVSFGIERFPIDPFKKRGAYQGAGLRVTNLNSHMDPQAINASPTPI